MNDVTLGVGETFDLKPVMPEGKEGAILCTVNDETVATVKDGIVTAVAPGQAGVYVITLDGNYKKTCQIDVKG